jgi:hypothetical protein
MSTPIEPSTAVVAVPAEIVPLELTVTVFDESTVAAAPLATFKVPVLATVTLPAVDVVWAEVVVPVMVVSA